MTNTQLPRHDFGLAGRLGRPVCKRLHDWLGKAAGLIPDQWASISMTTMPLPKFTIESATFGSLQSRWNKVAVAGAFSVGDQANAGMVVMEDLTMRMLINDLLGCPTEEDADPRLTSVEHALLELVFEVLLSCLSEGWPARETLDCRLEGLDFAPHRSRVFSPMDGLLRCTWELQLGDQAVLVQVLLHEAQAVNMLGRGHQAAAVAPTHKKLSSAKLQRVQVQLQATLGQCHLEPPAFTSLQVGDLLVLEQRIEDPILVAINGQPKFRAWIGRGEEHQTLKIHSTVTPSQPQ